MKKEVMLYGSIGLLVGVLIAGTVAAVAVNKDNHSMMQMMGMNIDTLHSHAAMDNDEMSMSDMTDMLRSKSGDDFDKAFMEQMIIHHEGAIEMAQLALTNAKHDEIKTMANDIVSAQSQEIEMMQTWQNNWGFENTSQPHNMHDM